jgi:glyoxylase-like metal-dependent hydrolase (beta-lactamase superfamily II)
VQLAPGVWRVATAPRDLVNTFVLRDEDGQVTLVDAGTKRAPKVVVAALEQIGVHVTDVTRILVTHAHGDHVGGLGGLRARTDAAMTRRTAEILGELDYDLVAFTHGPEIRTGAREAVRGFLGARRERDLARRSRRATTEDA